VDPDLASAIEDPARRRSALQTVTVGRLELVQGEQLDPQSLAADARFGVAVLSGFLVRELSTSARRVSADLLGPEDLIQLDGAEPEVAMLGHTVSWTAITDVRLALIDEDFFARTTRWPEIAATLLERSSRLGQRLALQGAIATLQTVDARLLASLWTWASQWATVAGQGVVLRVPLSHERLARLIHARRPTVTSAVGRLRHLGLIAQRHDGSWLLRGPRAGEDEQPAWDGVSMPLLGDMFARGLGVRKRPTSMTSADSRALGARELKARLAEQRATLRAAAKRHEEMLERMRRETGRLMATGAAIGERR
jgi:CRP-like cAMP-binding protein